MGSYAELSIGEYPLISTKSYALPEALTIFRETDKRVFDRMLSERNPLVWGTRIQKMTSAKPWSCINALQRKSLSALTSWALL